MYSPEIRFKKTPDPVGPMHSWSPPRRPTHRPPRSETLRDALRAVSAWVILIAVAIDVLAVVIEPALLLHDRAPLAGAVAAALSAVAFSILVSAVAALPIASVYSLVRLIGRLRGPLRHAWPAPLLLLAWLVVVNVAPHPFAHVLTDTAAHAIAFVAFAAWLVFATLVARLTALRARLAAAGLLVVANFGVSLSLPSSVHREPRDLLWLCTIVSGAALVYPLRRRLAKAPHEHVSRVLGGLAALSLACGLLAPLVSPSWRVYARDDGAFASRLRRFSRTLADFDGDGFSPAFGSSDCDDLDPSKNPGVREHGDGRDWNCNGQSAPRSPTPEQRGLATEAGDPDASPGTVDRVVLLTIDCMRTDAFRPDVTPNLTRLAARGVTFDKLYAGGTRTAISLPLVLRGAYTLPPIVARLHDAGVTSTALFGYRHSTLGPNIFEGFDVVSRPPTNDRRFRAAELTDMALVDLQQPANAKNHFLWVHYFDAHGPRVPRVLPGETPRFAPLRDEESESALYLSEIAYVDAEIGRLLDAIARSGDGFDKTLVIVSADHGEAFGRHNVYEHGESAFEEVTRVPGILVAPGIEPGRYDHVVSHRDIAATIVGAFGLVASTPDVETFGRSWLRLRDAPGAKLHDFVITYSAGAHVQHWEGAPLAVRTDDHAKLAVDYREAIARFYHLDPGDERVDLTYAYPAEAARARRQLEIYRDIDAPPP